MLILSNHIDLYHCTNLDNASSIFYTKYKNKVVGDCLGGKIPLNDVTHIYLNICITLQVKVVIGDN